ncbi:phosphopantetheine-binding [Catenulispora acidiphila DSM 44928]|uniref:Phosphopantetheine-binding n=1 Tax=Catenulispora acidiphila (strain DSM 44928 / JCM 14897 / NBRC 102108 / NRRL B-24433 / ID139908) TaxID=479433 RepID=C7PVG6_CATAD|nr:acyl carrier protein [Catenulispora acidiphila]ACU69322.1 phosphopantetheine-binding [Catenulispora acidiphila DSM 44928]
MESYQHVLDTLRVIIEGSVDEVAAGDITADSDLAGELGVDSLAMFEIADKAQERWNIKISDDDISRFTTVESLATFIQAAVGAQGLPAMTEA